MRVLLTVGLALTLALGGCAISSREPFDPTNPRQANELVGIQLFTYASCLTLAGEFEGERGLAAFERSLDHVAIATGTMTPTQAQAALAELAEVGESFEPVLASAILLGYAFVPSEAKASGYATVAESIVESCRSALVAARAVVEGE